MNGLLGMGLPGWVLSVVIGFVVGGIFFLSIKLQVEYVLENRGPTWLVPAALYARLVLMGLVLVIVALVVEPEKIAGAMLGGVGGALIARVLVSRLVRRRGRRMAEQAGEEEQEESEEDDEGD